MNFSSRIPRAAIVACCLLLLCLGLTGCQFLGRLSPLRSAQLHLTTLTDPKTFNPALNQDFPNVFLFTYEGLTRENGVNGAVEPLLAESWEISPDQRRVTFTLRADLKWSDGQPLTAEDVVFTFNDIIFNPKIPTDYKDSLKIGTEGSFPQVRKLDDRRVEFLLPEPFAPLLRAVASPEGVPIMPKHALAASVQTQGQDGNPLFVSTWGTNTDPKQLVVNGPFQIDRYSSGQRLVYRRNPHYWRSEQGQPLPYLNQITWQFIGNTDAQLLRFRSGELDVMGDVRPLRPEYFSLLKREERRGKFRVYNGGSWSGTLYLTFNLNRGRDSQGKPLVDPMKSRWFNQLAFRQAIAYALDRQRINNNIFRGMGILQDSPISVQSPYYLAPEQGLKVYNYNPEKARSLLLGAGFRYDNQKQLLDAEGNRVEFTLLTNAGNRLREAIGTQIKADLAQIGIQINFKPIDFNTLASRVNDSRDWEAHMIGFTGGIDPNGLANLWTSRGGSHSFNLAPQAGQQPIQGWQPNDWELEIDRLFQAGARELDETKRREIYGKFQNLVQEQLPVIHLVNETALMVVRDRVRGLKYTGLPSWGLWNIAELRIDP